MKNLNDAESEDAVDLFEEFKKIFDNPSLTKEEKDELAQKVLNVLLDSE